MLQSLATPRFQSQFLNLPEALIPCKIVDLDLVDYRQSFAFQLDVLAKRMCNQCPDTLILCEHFSVYTLGRLGKRENILVKEEELKRQGIEIIRISRGGDITFHGPGQLVIYPIFNLAQHKKDLKFFLHKLEEVTVEFLKHFGCFAYAKSGFTGAWVGEKKIASIGIAVKKWISFHGLAININTDLGFFSLIKPCGLNVQMTSLAEVINKKINLEQAKKIILEKFEAVFGLNYAISYLGGE